MPIYPNWKRFGRKLFVEIGSGHGELADFYAKENLTFVGFERNKKFARKANKKVLRSGNAFVLYGDAYTEYKLMFKKSSIDRLYILFPDPWHKKRHHKRRPLTTSFFAKIHKKMKKNSEIYFVTDHVEYYDFVVASLFGVRDRFQCTATLFTPESANLPATHYWKKWRSQGQRRFYALTVKVVK
jgi:tRNA (guanine-N7-)-methyltransferase